MVCIERKVEPEVLLGFVLQMQISHKLEADKAWCTVGSLFA